MKKFVVLTILALGLAGYAFDAKAAPPAFAGKGQVEVEVSADTGVCATVSVQCSPGLGSGHTFAAAASSNHNPMRLIVLVTRGGEGVLGLLEGDFTLASGFVPAGGGAPVLCDSIDCGGSNFQDAGAGLYGMFVDRGPPGNWNAGTYGTSLSVSFIEDSKTLEGIGLVTFTIP